MKQCAQEGLIWRRWGDEFVVYNPSSGDTHLLDFVSAQGLSQLEKHAFSARELVDELGDALAIAAAENLDQYVQRMLTEFSELCLTRPVQS